MRALWLTSIPQGEVLPQSAALTKALAKPEAFKAPDLRAPEDMLRMCELEAKIAYSSARCDLESYAVWQEDLQLPWLDVSPGLINEDACGFIEDAVEYLTLRGLLEFHPEREKWYRIRDLVVSL